MGKLLPLAIVLVATLGGGVAGHALRPPAPEGAAEAPDGPEPSRPAEDAIVSFRDGFVVPVLRDGHVWGHVVLSLGAQADHTTREDILLREPLLRDSLNQALFLHSNLGGFDGDFTAPQVMERLRERLDGALAAELADETARVLIVSMARQAV